MLECRADMIEADELEASGSCNAETGRKLQKLLREGNFPHGNANLSYEVVNAKIRWLFEKWRYVRYSLQCRLMRLLALLVNLYSLYNYSPVGNYFLVLFRLDPRSRGRNRRRSGGNPTGDRQEAETLQMGLPILSVDVPKFQKRSGMSEFMECRIQASFSF